MDAVDKLDGAASRLRAISEEATKIAADLAAASDEVRSTDPAGARRLQLLSLSVLGAESAVARAADEGAGMARRLRTARTPEPTVCKSCRGAKVLHSTSAPAGFAGAQHATVRCHGCNGSGWEG